MISRTTLSLGSSYTSLATPEYQGAWYFLHYTSLLLYLYSFHQEYDLVSKLEGFHPSY